ncbi:MAG: hypothetical protein QOI23_863, partial [Chloroflexota bacterium]|nr:hypothetical protein [Chloroflexota bacterium]
FGAPGGNRTPDLDVRTVLLYPLSYEGARSRVYCQDGWQPGFAGALLLSKLPRFSQEAFRATRHIGIMENENMTDKRIQARDAASRMLNRLTAGLAFGAVAGVGLFSAVSAYTIPGTASTTAGATASTPTTSGSTSTSTGLQASPTPVSSSGSGVAVSGGS